MHDASPDGGGVVGADVVGGGLEPPVLTFCENELTASPTPPCHGSKPAWMLVRYQSLVIAPRLRVSLMNASASKLKLGMADGDRYEMTLFEPLLPRHTSQVRPAMLAVPTGEPMGWIEPCRLSQIMISIWFTPSRFGDGSSQMSYDALKIAPLT